MDVIFYADFILLLLWALAVILCSQRAVSLGRLPGAPLPALASFRTGAVVSLLWCVSQMCAVWLYEREGADTSVLLQTLRVTQDLSAELSVTLMLMFYVGLCESSMETLRVSMSQPISTVPSRLWLLQVFLTLSTTILNTACNNLSFSILFFSGFTFCLLFVHLSLWRTFFLIESGLDSCPDRVYEVTRTGFQRYRRFLLFSSCVTLVTVSLVIRRMVFLGTQFGQLRYFGSIAVVEKLEFSALCLCFVDAFLILRWKHGRPVATSIGPSGYKISVASPRLVQVAVVPGAPS
eukprot:TRINITY_DN1731_c0_g1_i2.p1 TRINITY_DN1731_c0_g1~~TRINITY_DN1731_c0_g1_i2.p1  ORF type:complete len:292 (-),score=13.32 TRINITY_DN1731_c0_g1_i2:959-1834(-)